MRLSRILPLSNKPFEGVSLSRAMEHGQGPTLPGDVAPSDSALQPSFAELYEYVLLPLAL